MATLSLKPLGDTINWKEVFDVQYNDDGNLTLISKQLFSHQEESYNFNYHYVIVGTDIMKASGDANASIIDVTLYLCPTPDSWSVKKLHSIAYLYGYEDKSDEELRLGLVASDLVEAGSGIIIEREEIYYNAEENDEGFYDVLDNEDVVKQINNMATVLQATDSLRGFSLDCCKNRIGTTGWDMLDEILKGEDSCQKAINRWKESNGTV